MQMCRRFFISVIAAMAFVFARCVSNPEVSKDPGEADAAFIEEIERDYAIGEFIVCMNTIKVYLAEEEAGERVAHPAALAKAYKLLGNVHIQYEDFTAAEKYYNTGIIYAAKLDDKTEHLKLLHNLTINSLSVQNREKAIEYRERMSRVGGADKGLQRYYYILESAYIERVFGDVDKAINLMRQVIECVDSHKLPQELKESPIGEISGYLADLGRYDEALKVINVLDSRLDSTSKPGMRIGCLKSYSRLYALMGDSGKSAKYRQMYMELSDSLMNHNRFLKARSSFNETGRELKSGKVESLAAEVRLYRWISAGGVSVLIFFGIVWLWGKKRRKRNVCDSSGPGDSRGVSGDAASPRRRNTSFYAEDDAASLFVRIAETVGKRDNYSDPHFSLERLAQMLDSNAKYISKAVNTVAGENFRSYLNGIRIREARLRLDSASPDEEVSIRGLAHSVGFMSQSAFIAAFKKAAGNTPSGYLKEVRAAGAENQTRP